MKNFPYDLSTSNQLSVESQAINLRARDVNKVILR